MIATELERLMKQAAANGLSLLAYVLEMAIADARAYLDNP